MRQAKMLALLALVLVTTGVVAVTTAIAELPNGWREIPEHWWSGLAVLPLLIGLPLLTFAFGRLAQPKR